MLGSIYCNADFLEIPESILLKGKPSGKQEQSVKELSNPHPPTPGSCLEHSLASMSQEV